MALEFFETVVRYDKFFLVEPQHIPNVLVSVSNAFHRWSLLKTTRARSVASHFRVWSSSRKGDGHALSFTVLYQMSAGVVNEVFFAGLCVDGVSGPSWSEAQQPQGQEPGGLPLLPIRENITVSLAHTHTHTVMSLLTGQE